MKQLLQNLQTGLVEVVEVPSPAPEPGRVLVRVEASLISAGTEGHQVAAAGKSLVGRIVEKPQLVRKGLRTLRDRGVAGLREQIAAKYAGYEMLGYSCAGVVVACGDGVTSFRIGQRVACGGIGFACHAEFVSVPVNLCAIVPDGVEAEAAAYTTLGAIAMQGVRQAEARVGETVVVIGLGLVGLLATQLLRAAGCNVLGIDPNPAARKRGLENGCHATADATSAPDALASLSRGIGADAVVICAATRANDPVVLAGELARSRGRVVMVGATGMELPRELYFRKEITFTLSRSYGPGRYDHSYEEDGLDYPVDFVRFTEQRNMQAFLDLAATGRVHPASLTTHRFPLADAPNAYGLLNNREVDRVGLVLTYATATSNDWKSGGARVPTIGTSAAGPGISLIGAGAYAKAALLPLFSRQPDVRWRGVMTRSAATAASVAKSSGFAFAATTAEEILRDAETHSVLIATRHDAHAELAAAALRAGKHVWVEKPLALTLEEFRAVRDAHRARPELKLAVGFNRPFSPLARWVREQLGGGGPLMINYRVNAGLLPADHWTNDPRAGGGRLLGEGCHFLDFMRSFCGEAVRVNTTAVLGSGRADLPASGNFSVAVTFADGSVGTLVYSAQGSPKLPKERIELFRGHTAAVIDDFLHAQVCTGDNIQTRSLKQQDKGQAAMIEAFLQGAIPRADDYFASSLLTLAAQASLERQTPVDLASFS